MQQDLTCAKCSELSNRILALECEHSLCIPCASKHLTSHSGSRPPNQIECQICGCVSLLHPSSYSHLVPKDNPNLGRQHVSRSRPLEHETVLDMQGQSMLFCTDCQRACFSIDDYLNGMHSGHSVKNVRKSHHILKEILGQLADGVRQRVQLSVSESSKLVERKKELVENFGSIKKELKVNFQRVRILLAEKEQQLQTQLQQVMAKMFSTVDNSLVQVRQYLAKCQYTHKEIEQNMAEGKVKGFNYYSNRKENIIQQVNIPIETVSRDTLAEIKCVTPNHQPLMNVLEALKRIRLQFGQTVTVARQVLTDDFFQAKRYEVFSQTVKKDFRNNTLSSVKSMECLKADTSGNARMKSQKTLEDRLRDLETLVGSKNTPSRNGLSNTMFRHM